MRFDPRRFFTSINTQLMLALSICLGLGGGIMAVLQARQLSRVIKRVFLDHQLLDAVLPLVIAIFSIILLRAASTWAGEVCASAAARRIKQDLRQRLFSHLLKLGPAYLSGEAGESRARTGELVITATEGIDALEGYISQYLPQIGLAALIPVAILFFVFPLDALSGVIFLLTAPLLPLFMYLIGSTAQALTRKQWLGLGRMSAYFMDVLQGLTTLKILGAARQQIEIIRRVSDQYRQTTMSVLRVTFLSALVLELVATLSTAVVAVEIGIRLLYGRLAFEQAFFLLLLAPEFYQPLRLLGTRFHAGIAGVEAARRIFEILDLPLPAHSQNSIGELNSSKQVSSPPTISIQDVSFSYSNGHPAVRGVSFDVPPGKLTALVGESGAGKTTLTWLLMGFLSPQSGQILVDGTPISELSNAQWQAKLAWVPQNPYLFNDTILANIKLADPGADDNAVLEAARLAHADEFIRRLPEGYYTQIGERGTRVSAGQAQRIALARAFLKDAPFLVLDEATSHLDPETDALVRLSLQRLAIHRTVLVIAHHQNTLALADQVVRLSHGRLVEVQVAAGQQVSIAGDELRAHPTVESPVQSLPVPVEGKPPTRLRQGVQKTPVARRLLKSLAPYTGRILLSVLLGFATILSGVGLMATAAYIISAAALHPSIADLQVAIVGVRFFGLSRGVFRYLERLVSHDMTLRLLAGWRSWFYKALEPLAPGRLMSYHSGDLLTRVISDIGSLENFYVRAIAPPGVAILVSVTAVVFLGSFGTQLAWGLLIFLILAGIGLPFLTLLLSRELGPGIVTQRARLGTLLVDGIQGMADLLTCGQAQNYQDKVRLAGERLTKLQFRMALLTATHNALSSLLASLAMLAVLVFAIPLVGQGMLDGVFLGVVSLTALTCFEALQPLPLAAQYSDSNLTAAARLYELVDAPPLVTDPEEPLSLPAQPDLEMQQVCFQYPPWLDEPDSKDQPAFRLSDISFTLPAGRHIAVVGQSGSGKTTLVNLLLRFWEYQQGSILLGGHALRQYNQDDLRSLMAVISQNTYLFSATILENLRLANPRASTEQVFQAARQAQLHDFILALPEGYNTWIGEHGLRLSAGERQRLAVARAFLKGAPVLILDEPTAQLDQLSAQALLNTISALSDKLSTITITQSMTGLEAMDEILVLHDGRIVERGTHGQLLAAKGLYSRMWNLYHQLI